MFEYTWLRAFSIELLYIQDQNRHAVFIIKNSLNSTKLVFPCVCFPWINQWWLYKPGPQVLAILHFRQQKKQHQIHGGKGVKFRISSSLVTFSFFRSAGERWTFYLRDILLICHLSNSLHILFNSYKFSKRNLNHTQLC